MTEDRPGNLTPLTGSMEDSTPACSREETALNELNSAAKANSTDWLGWLVSGAAIMLFKPIVEDLLSRLKHIGPNGMDFYPPDKKEDRIKEMPTTKKGKKSTAE